MSGFTEERNMGNICSFSSLFIICTHNVISISTCIMYLLFFPKKLSIKDMADFPVPTQDVTSDDKQGMERMSFLPLGTFYLCFFIHFSWNGWLLKHVVTGASKAPQLICPLLTSDPLLGIWSY